MSHPGLLPGFPMPTTITQASGAGGDVNCYIRPLTHDVWIIQQLIASHNDAARTCQWGGFAPATILWEGLAVAVPHYFYNDLPGSQLFVLNYDSYLCYAVSAMAAARTITVTAWIHLLKDVR